MHFVARHLELRRRRAESDLVAPVPAGTNVSGHTGKKVEHVVFLDDEQSHSSIRAREVPPRLRRASPSRCRTARAPAARRGKSKLPNDVSQRALSPATEKRSPLAACRQRRRPAHPSMPRWRGAAGKRTSRMSASGRLMLDRPCFNMAEARSSATSSPACRSPSSVSISAAGSGNAAISTRMPDGHARSLSAYGGAICRLLREYSSMASR